MTCVLDASMALSFVLDDEFTRASEHALEHIAAHGGVVPALWDYEVANGLASARRRSRLTTAQAATSVNALSMLPLERDGRIVDRHILTSLAIDTGLSAYDAAYLELALHTNSWLASLDKQLLSAAKKLGIATTAT
jgi:predicted nucleic acid-binding protein